MCDSTGLIIHQMNHDVVCNGLLTVQGLCHDMNSVVLDDLEKRYDTQFKVVFDAIRALVAEPKPKEKR